MPPSVPAPLVWNVTSMYGRVASVRALIVAPLNGLASCAVGTTGAELVVAAATRPLAAGAL